MDYYLRQIEHNKSNLITINLDKDEIIIGRKAYPMLNKYLQVSRNHARFRKIDDNWFVEDMHSLNGVYLNGRKISESLEKVEIGDHIGLGAPTPSSDCDVFICTLTVRTVKKDIVVIDLCDEDIPAIKKEPPDDYTSDIKVEDPTHHLNLPVDIFKSSNNENDSVKDIKIVHDLKKTGNDVVSYPSTSDESIKKTNLCNNDSRLNDINSSQRDSLCQKNNFKLLTDTTTQLSSVSGNVNNQQSNNSISLFNKEIKISNSQDCFKKCDDKQFKIHSDVKHISCENEKDIQGEQNSEIIIPQNELLSSLECRKKPDFPELQNKLNKGIDFEISEDCIKSNSNQAKPIAKESIINCKSSAKISHNLNTCNSNTQCLLEIKSLDNAEQFSSELSKNPINVQKNFININLSDDEKKKDDVDNSGYSITEDEIIIIDDDDYMDFASSQPVIKQEPLDEEEMEIHYEDVPVEIPNQAPDILEEDENFSESIENIQRYVQSTASTSKSNIDNMLNKPHVSKGINIEDFFPMSQLYKNSSDEEDVKSSNCIVKPMESSLPNDSNSNSSVSSHDSIIIPSKFKKTTGTDNKESAIKEKASKSIGKAVLIEPLRMNHRPSKLRGREEWFEDKSSENISTVPIQEAKKSKRERIKESKKQPQKLIKTKKNSKQSSVNKLHDVKSKGKNSAKAHTIKKKELKPSASVSLPPKVELTKRSSRSMKKNPAISRLPGKYASRSAFLVEPVNERKKLLSQKKQLSCKKESPCEPSNKTSAPVLDKKNETTSNYKRRPKRKEVPSIASISQSNMIKESVSMVFNITDQNKIVPTARIHPLTTTTTFPFNNRSFPTTASRPLEYASNRDPRLFRKFSSEYNTNSNFPVQVQIPHINHSSHQLFMNDGHQLPQMINRNVSCLTQPPELHGKSSNQNQCSAALSNFRSPVPSSNYQSSANVKPLREPQNQTSSQVDFISVIKKIVELNVKWLEEQQKLDKPPPLVKAGSAPLPLFFNSVNHYISSFAPMLLLEIWDLLCQEAKPIFQNSKRVVNKFYFKIISSESKYGMIVYNCEAIVNKVSFSPSEGNVVIMEIYDKSTKKCFPCFAYVFGHGIEELKNDMITDEWKKVNKMWLENAKFWQFSVYAKSKEISPHYGHLMKGNGICSIRSKVRLIDALKNLELSPLCKFILQPNAKDFFVKYPNVSPEKEFSNSQNMAIEGISSEILNSDYKPKIILLQGPPGTGKTHTIIGLLQKLIRSNTKLKILVTAPSNAAIDVIGSRLIDLNDRLSWRSQEGQMKFVRVGLPDQINSKLKPFTLDALASKLAKDYDIKITESREKEIEKLQSELDALKKQKFDYKTEQKIKFLADQQRKIKRLLKSKNYGGLRNCKYQVLRESNIVLSTLGSCRQPPVSSFLKSNSFYSFSCCIIDEASQCTEIEALIPLMFGINKLIMIGDHKQLPATVNSKIALACNYDRSMFERFHLCFSKHCQFNPIFMLAEQFRMHSEIALFPSKNFYENLLITAPHNDIQCINFPIHPYIVYDIVESQESDTSNSKLNSIEALAIVNICAQLLTLVSHASIGIITPYQGQRNLYLNSLGHNPKYKHIEVNTVDSFQGREKDIIILSCVRASPTGGIGFLSCPKRLNVAITRACKCLIICVHSNTLKQDENWAKLIEDARVRHLCRTVTSYKDIQLIFHATMIKKTFTH